jgi:hypothetical protein
MGPKSRHIFLSMRIWIQSVTVKKVFPLDLPIRTLSLLLHFNASKMLLKIILYAENATRQYLQPFLDRFPQKFRVRSQVRKNMLHNDNANVS